MGTWGHSAALAEASLGEFGGPATFTANGGAAEACVVVLDDAHKVVTIDSEGLPIDTTEIRIYVRVSDLSRRPRMDDRFTVSGTTYLVSSVQNGGDGDVFCVVKTVE
tara:strand:- start:550 stop:870 length:321 start_codon:yes stop_codon:yes gene_type:complete